LSERVERVRGRMREATRRANRAVEEITLVAVSKTHPAAAIQAALETGLAEPPPFGLETARSQVSLLSPQALQASKPPVVIFVDTSQDFARGHVPGAHWVPRGWLELRIAEVAPARETPVAVTCLDGRSATLAGATLKELGYQSVAVLDGGMAAWQKAGLPVEKGLAGVMAPPNDVVLSGPDRNFADMMNYLRWEEALGYKYASTAH